MGITEVGGTVSYHTREGKGHIAVPACGGSLTEAKRACDHPIQDEKMCCSNAPIPRSALSAKRMPHFLSTTSLS
eukprot:1144977-Pelagomonas_calceolata.AAC.9